MRIVYRGIGIGLAALSLAGWALPAPVETALYSFKGGSDGAVPLSGVIAGEDGALYGATSAGGGQGCINGNGCGTVFELSPPKMKGGACVENVLYRFQGGNDGAGPFGGIVEKDGLLYGTTQGGGAFGNGTVFQLTPPTNPGGKWTKTVLYSFQGGSDGVNPQGGLLAGRDDGALYGTTYGGGNSYGRPPIPGGNGRRPFWSISPAASMVGIHLAL